MLHLYRALTRYILVAVWIADLHFVPWTRMYVHALFEFSFGKRGEEKFWKEVLLFTASHARINQHCDRVFPKNRFFFFFVSCLSNEKNEIVRSFREESTIRSSKWSATSVSTWPRLSFKFDISLRETKRVGVAAHTQNVVHFIPFSQLIRTCCTRVPIY